MDSWEVTGAPFRDSYGTSEGSLLEFSSDDEDCFNFGSDCDDSLRFGYSLPSLMDRLLYPLLLMLFAGVIPLFEREDGWFCSGPLREDFRDLAEIFDRMYLFSSSRCCCCSCNDCYCFLLLANIYIYAISSAFFASWLLLEPNSSLFGANLLDVALTNTDSNLFLWSTELCLFELLEKGLFVSYRIYMFLLLPMQFMLLCWLWLPVPFWFIGSTLVVVNSKECCLLEVVRAFWLPADESPPFFPAVVLS